MIPLSSNPFISTPFKMIVSQYQLAKLGVQAFGIHRGPDLPPELKTDIKNIGNGAGHLAVHGQSGLDELHAFVQVRRQSLCLEWLRIRR